MVTDQFNEQTCREVVSVIISNPKLTAALDRAAKAKKERREVDLVGHQSFCELEFMYTVSDADLRSAVESAVMVKENMEGEGESKYSLFCELLDSGRTPGEVRPMPSVEDFLLVIKECQMLTPTMVSACVSNWIASKTFILVRPEHNF